MADNNRDDRKTDDLDEPVVAVPLPVTNTGNGYIPVVPLVAPVETTVDNADVERRENKVVGFVGYDSSDDRINREIDDHLAEHSYIDTSAVTVTVKDGKVTLEGSVPDADQKIYVQEVVVKIEGVKNVENRLKVKKPQTTLTENTTGKQ